MFSNEDRHKVIEEVKELISIHHGYITHFQLYSDLALVLTLEIEEQYITALHEAFERMAVISEINSELFRHEASKEWIIMLNLSFGQGKGELKVEVPAVPG